MRGQRFVTSDGEAEEEINAFFTLSRFKLYLFGLLALALLGALLGAALLLARAGGLFLLPLVMATNAGITALTATSRLSHSSWRN